MEEKNTMPVKDNVVDVKPATVPAIENERGTGAQEMGKRGNTGGQYSASQGILPKESAYTKGMKRAYPYFSGISLLYGVVYTFCMYRNPAGITFPLLVVATLALAALCLKKIRQEAADGGGEMGKMEKRRWFRPCTFPYLVAMALLGISTCLTANDFFHSFNKVAIVMLFSAAMLHQLYEDGKWSFPIYMRNLFVFWGSCLSSLFKVFSHAATYRAEETEISERKKKASAILKGVGLACLVLLVVLPLLVSSDLIVAEWMITFLEDISFAEGIFITFDFFVGIILFYAFLAGLFRQNIGGAANKEKKRAESLTGITFISILAVIYVFYAAVQIIYLFLRAGTLPGDLTYSQYAHEGFWQLLLVSMLNIVMILVCMQVFQKHKVLNVLLLVISLCTCVMAASAAYRMILYVGAYGLTFLRILVLWFLGVLSLVMVGMMVAIFKERFPLFQYSVAVLACCYIAFSFVRVDAVIASYNIKNWETMRMTDVWYLMSLSEDAAPYIAKIEPEMVADLEENYENWSDVSDENFLVAQKNQYFEYILQKDMSLRQWNYGILKARETAEDYFRGE